MISQNFRYTTNFKDTVGYDTFRIGSKAGSSILLLIYLNKLTLTVLSSKMKKIRLDT